MDTTMSITRIYENNETIVGAFNEFNGAYTNFMKGFIYNIRMGVYQDV